MTTSGMFTTKFKADDNNDLKLTALVINKVTDQVFEGGREGTASIFEETDEGEAFQFIRDQNLKKTLVERHVAGELGEGVRREGLVGEGRSGGML